MRSLRIALGSAALVSAMAASVIATSVVVTSVASAQVSGSIGRIGGAGPVPNRPGNGYPQPRPDYPQQRQVYVGRYLRDQTMSLGQALRLGETCFGGQVESVVVNLTDSSRRGSIALMMDYNQVDFRSYPNNVEVLRPRYNSRIGIDFQDIGLRVMDKIYIDSIVATVSGCGSYGPAPYPGPGPGPSPYPGNGGDNGNYGSVVEIERVISQNFNGFGQFDLTQAMDFYRYQGYQIQSVEIVGGAGESSPLPIAFVALMLNGSEQGRVQLIGKFMQSQSLTLSTPIQINRDMGSLSLMFLGDVRIERVRFKLARIR